MTNTIRSTPALRHANSPLASEEPRRASHNIISEASMTNNIHAYMEMDYDDAPAGEPPRSVMSEPIRTPHAGVLDPDHNIPGAIFLLFVSAVGVAFTLGALVLQHFGVL